GLDARAFRLSMPPGTTVFEVDTAPVHEFKREVIAAGVGQPLCKRVPVVADLRDDWQDALVASGFAPDEPAVWLAEGLLMYLSAADSDRLLDTISNLSRSTNWLATAYFEAAPTEELMLSAAVDDRDREFARMLPALFETGP